MKNDIEGVILAEDTEDVIIINDNDDDYIVLSKEWILVKRFNI